MEMMKALMVLSLMMLSVMAEGALLGGWKPIKDVSDPHVVEIAKYAVEEHNKQSKTDLKLDRVVSGQTQVVAGTNYKLIIAASDGKSYEAIVWEKPWEHFRKLTSFRNAN
ncbi:PREDICTED: cysteine proteinase inhibitor 5 [Tarenaya hassleriana]|uniref:cysteine proteinase inhibitor 5 n=1 Tax=Tarenaya hassleriana TaxID=28532 RepID=UPI00053C34DC|nr:PREDICTED: cysteine proteinase inhibitor 5 [Tarenaya hassleriana]